MKNRLTPYAAGWLTLLVSMGVATDVEARAAQMRVAQAAIDELHERRLAKRAEKRRRRKKTDDGLGY